MELFSIRIQRTFQLVSTLMGFSAFLQTVYEYADFIRESVMCIVFLSFLFLEYGNATRNELQQIHYRQNG